MPRELRLLKARAVPAPVVLGQALDALPGHRAGQQARAHRRIGDHPDALAFGERQDLVLDLAGDQRVRRLQRLDRRDLLDPPQLADVEVGNPDVTHEPLLLQLGQGRPALLDVRLRDRPVDLVEVDRVHTEPLEAALGLPQDRVALQVVHHPAAGSLHERRLGEDVRPSLQARESAADDLLRMTETIGGRFFLLSPSPPLPPTLAFLFFFAG